MANVDRVAYTTEPTASSERLLTIGEFARRSRLSTKALRLYERRRLLVPAAVDESNGYRRYRESQLAPARLIAMLRRIDMPLTQVAEVVAAPEQRAGELVATYWAAVERRIAGQRGLASHLQIRLTGAEGSYDMFEIQQRDVAEQLVLTEQRHIRAGELPTWMGAAFGRLQSSAERFGGVAGPALAIFHGEVNEDSDGRWRCASRSIQAWNPARMSRPGPSRRTERRSSGSRRRWSSTPRSSPPTTPSSGG
jgi:DNA-binding transcriptional MerR regulator